MKDQKLFQITEITKTKHFVYFHELASMLEVSISTVKRYAKQLAKENALIVVRGGVRAIGSREIGIASRLKINSQAKAQIAKKANELISKNLVIYLDAGTTCLNLAHLLDPNIELKVITSNIDALNVLMCRGVKTYVLGGKLNPKTSAIVGSIAIEQAQNYFFDIAFLGCNGFNKKLITTTNIEEAALKKMIVNQSHKVYFLGDSSKENLVYSFKVVETKRVGLITEKVIKENL